jgi:hypothetical protein
MSKANDTTPVNLEPGCQFEKFKTPLNGVHSAGYLTNKNTGRTNNDGIYLQAQYYLAPTVLTLNEAADEFNVIDYTHSSFAVYKVKELKSKLVDENAYGQALVQKKKS